MHDRQPSLIAVTGPTNTGKTWFAIDRMIGFRTGMIGLPLRLLAREVYDRVVALRGLSSAALITGEERIVPPNPSYWICTVEAMPHRIGVEFMAVDEIQLCADPERGHVFTDRLLHARGRYETMFLGASTMRGAIGDLLPDVKFRSRSRLSSLSHAGARKITRLKPRSAVVCFSIENVYTIAELIRRNRGGTAVVTGALSPRTRNAQVAMYESGDVDTLVATDAIGMGLNLDISHVAFAGLRKFDGRRTRRLAANELAQIAGRAGRFLSSGTFGVTWDVRGMEANVVEAIENNRFAPIRKLQWRNTSLEFGSLEGLTASLEKGSEDPRLVRAREADDLRALRQIADLPEIADGSLTLPDIKLLWEICQIPDFPGESLTNHVDLLTGIFRFVRNDGVIPGEWLESKMCRIDCDVGDVDLLSRRIARIRTWTYVSQRGQWLDDADYWRLRARDIEDRLSDALHAGLMQRFVDQKTSVLLRRLRQKEKLVATVNDNGDVIVEGQVMGSLEGFRFIPGPDNKRGAMKAVEAACLQALVPQFHLRASRLANAPNLELGITEQGGIMWGSEAVGRLTRSDDPLAPGIESFVDEGAGQEVRSRVERRLRAYVDSQISESFGQLLALRNDQTLSGTARGVAYRLVEDFGIISRFRIANEIKALDQDARRPLRAHGVRFGQYSVFMRQLLKPGPTRLRIVIWSLREGHKEYPPAPPPSLVTIPRLKSVPRGYYPLCGYHPARDLTIRVDMLERLANLIRAHATEKEFEATADMLSITGLSLAQFALLMEGLGYKSTRKSRVKNTRENTASPAVPYETSTESTEQDKGPTVTKASDRPAETQETEGPAEPEVVEYFTFARSRYRGPNRRRHGKQDQSGTGRPIRSRNKKRQKGYDPSDRRRPGKNASREYLKRGKPARKSAKARTVDPDNPFAALLKVREKL